MRNKRGFPGVIKLKREARNVGPLAGVFDCDAANVPIPVEIKKDILIQILGSH